MNLVHGRGPPMIGPKVFRGTDSKASRFATSESTFFSAFISRAYSISCDIETKRSDFKM